MLQPKIRTGGDLLFVMTAGVFFAWSLVAAIISTTVLEQQYMGNFLRVAAVMGLFAFIGSKKVLRLGTILLVGLAVGFVAFGFFREESTALVDFLERTFQFVIGIRPAAPAYERTVLWALSALIGLLVVSFAYFRDQFFILLATGALIFTLAFASPYFEPTNAFIAFALSLLMLLGKHLSGAKTQFRTGKFPLPLVLTVSGSLLLGAMVPAPDAGLMPTIMANPWDFFADWFFHLTRDNEFSLQGIGFGGGGGLLGGDVALNNRLFMRIQTNRRGTIYLTGAVMDTYTGNSWENTFSEGKPVEFDSVEAQLAALETVTRHDLNWVLEHYEGLAAGRFVQFVIPEEWGWYEPDYVRAFEDPVTGRMIFVDTNANHDWTWDPAHNFRTNTSTMTLDVSLGRPTSGFHTGILQGVETEGIDFYRVSERNLFTQRPIPRHSRYTITYLDFMHSPIWNWTTLLDAADFYVPGFQEGILTQARDTMTMFREQFGYELMHAPLLINNETISFEDLLTDYFIPRAQQIRERYTALPESLPERVREYAQLVTAEGRTDHERMRLLEAYLSQNFPYTLTPGPSPRDRDFVDHFLFDLRTGYCVHFATAFVVMARSLGLPTRYVEGFLVTGRPEEDGFIDVTNNMAHAWPEVYFEGYGWQRFEPTPAYGLPHNYDPNRGESANVATPPRDPSEFTNWSAWDHYDPEYWAMREQQSGGASSGTTDTDTTPTGDSPVAVDTAEETDTQPPWLWISTGMVGAIFLIFLVIYQKRRKLGKFQHREAVLYAFNKMIVLLNPFASNIKDSETVPQFMARVHIGSYDERRLLKKATAVYVKARYSQEEITEQERRLVAKALSVVKKHSKSEFGVLRWRLLRLRLK